MQSRTATNAEAASQLAIAANRVSMIARVHRRLHSYDDVQTIDFKKFLEDFGGDFSTMLSSDDRPKQVLVEGIEINLPAAAAIPLGFIVSELIANAAKYGTGRIAVSLRSDRHMTMRFRFPMMARHSRKASIPAPAKDLG